MKIASAAQLRSPSEALGRYQWIDVRSPGEFAAGHIPGAVNIPMDQIEARIDDLLPAAEIVLVCQAGKRARMVASLLEPCRSDVTVLEGGTAAWAAAGLPLVTSVKSRFSLERQVRLIAAAGADRRPTVLDCEPTLDLPCRLRGCRLGLCGVD